MRGALLAELWLAGRFALVGCAATAVHMLVVWLLLSNGKWPALMANSLAFLAAFAVSFSGNYAWTFGRPGPAIGALVRFFLVSATAFAVDTLLLTWMLPGPWESPAAAAVMAAGCVPVITFLAGRCWAFRPGQMSRPKEDAAPMPSA